MTGFLLAAAGLAGLVFAFETAGREMLPVPVVAGLFLRVLLTAGVSGLSIMAIAAFPAFGPGSSVPLLAALLLAGGFVRSLHFTSLNVIAYADIPPPLMSRATSLVSTCQQLSLSVGVATGPSSCTSR